MSTRDDPFTEAILYLAALTDSLGEVANRDFWERLASYALDTAGEYA